MSKNELKANNVELSGLRGGGSAATGTPQIRLSEGLGVRD